VFPLATGEVLKLAVLHHSHQLIGLIKKEQATARVRDDAHR
jgi:hypothetical protein